ncbi:hypothetical protein TEA_006088 [Camellia sinensis var. sinensis]|uniref:Uncharacterized protein n=1 Tax=Camellia sinensis var. sinensis TaxID=542762 RepID=A0A4S4DHS1_CAMSN|nr:hypothetical protein TEA_006088 [Camellia sinensis var. sinensis]
MSGGAEEQISLFRSRVELRRFDDGTLRILESILVSKDVKSLLEVRSSLREFTRRESLCIIREIADKSVEHKLFILEFLSCVAFRYEALFLRQLRSTSNQWLQVSYREWMTFAEHSLNNGFYSIARMACESALACFEINGMVDPQTDDFFKNVEVIGKIKRLKDVAVVSSASQSDVSNFWFLYGLHLVVTRWAQTAEYLKKKAVETRKPHFLDYKEAQSSASTLFRDGIKKRNVRKLRDHQSIIHLNRNQNVVVLELLVLLQWKEDLMTVSDTLSPVYGNGEDLHIGLKVSLMLSIGNPRPHSVRAGALHASCHVTPFAHANPMENQMASYSSFLYNPKFSFDIRK